VANGVVPFANPLVEWSETNHVRWKLALPGKGHSSPIVFGDRVGEGNGVKHILLIFLPQAANEGGALRTLLVPPPIPVPLPHLRPRPAQDGLSGPDEGAPRRARPGCDLA